MNAGYPFSAYHPADVDVLRGKDMRVLRCENKTGGFLSRLARDRKGNVIAILAIALIPTAAFAGSAVDLTRLYVIRSRLQQACDAGALVGRRQMIDDADHELDTAARQYADDFFKNNFRNGWLGTKSTKSFYQESGTQQVVGSAETIAPMLMMGMFGSGDKKLKVECAARLDIPDVDVMLVLDTTGSMAATPAGTGSSGTAQSYRRSDGTTGYAVPEVSGSRMAALRDAVIDFYDAMDYYTDDRTNVRYGFVPYSSSANVGRIMPSEYILATQHDYQSRRIRGDTNYRSPQTRNVTLTQAQCNLMAGRHTAANVPQPAAEKIYNATGDAYKNTVNSWSAANGGTCNITQQRVVPLWKFAPVTHNIGEYAKGGSVLDPTKYVQTYVKWRGCVEERPVKNAVSSYDPEKLPADMDPDLKPDTDDRRWRPLWPEVEYERRGVWWLGLPDEIPDSYFTGKESHDLRSVYSNVLQSGPISCGKEAQRLRKMSREEVSAFVNHEDFKPLGGTYHDVGMTWGLRFMSPSGPFSEDTKPWPGRGEPNRNIIFMTDGAMDTNIDVYGMNGFERHDQRVGRGDLSKAGLDAKHNARFRAICDAAELRGITVWVIAFGEKLNADLEDCATRPFSQHAFQAKNKDELKAAFRRIAKQVGSLRVYK